MTTDNHTPSDALETVIVPRARDLGGFEVRRALPATQRQMVGPFVFLDQMGPADFAPGQGIDVRPHPHIGLSTVTWLYEGKMRHADSLGNDMVIEPGQVNWMTAGHGITHSERSLEESRRNGFKMSGLQTWVALPREHEDRDPSFDHRTADELPIIEDDGARVTLILGDLYGQRAPSEVFSPLFYADVQLQPGAKLPLDQRDQDRAIYIFSGAIELAGEVHEAGRMLVLKPGEALSLQAREASRLMLLGGEPLDEPRHLWWNFVSSSLEKLEQAKQDWRTGDWQNGRFRLPPTDNGEFIPLP
ncbi:MAG: pirin family protein [Litorivicinus sp.]